MLGIFVHPLYVQNEGIQQVFDNLESVDAEAICITPRVACPAEEGRGVRFPPLHVDGYERVMARTLWGKHELRLEFFSSHKPDLDLYEGGVYRPSAKLAPPGMNPEIPSIMIAEAKKRGMQAHMLLQPFVPPDIRVEDQPVYVDGSTPQPPQVSLNACLNSSKADGGVDEPAGQS